MGFTEVYDYGPGKVDWTQAGLPTEGTLADEPRAWRFARSDVPTCPLDASVGEARGRARDAGFTTCVVVNDERVVLGILRERQFRADDEVPVERAMRPGPSTFRGNVPIDEMATYMIEHDLVDAPITTAQGELLGLLLRDDAVRAALEAVERHRREHEGHESG